MKKYPKKGYTIDPSLFSSDFQSHKATRNFNYQYDYFTEQDDLQFSDPILTELDTIVFVDANHNHNTVTGKAITGLLSFIVSTPVE